MILPLTALQSWALLTMLITVAIVWVWHFIWAEPDKPKKSRSYGVRCPECTWYAIHPEQLVCAQWYAKHYEETHA